MVSGEFLMHFDRFLRPDLAAILMKGEDIQKLRSREKIWEMALRRLVGPLLSS